MTGRLRIEYMMTMTSENIVLVPLPYRSSIREGMVMAPIFKKRGRKK